MLERGRRPGSRSVGRATQQSCVRSLTPGRVDMIEGASRLISEMSKRPELPAPILVGVSPAGVEWWARHEGDEEILRTKLTPRQRELVEDAIEGWEGHSLHLRSTRKNRPTPQRYKVVRPSTPGVVLQVGDTYQGATIEEVTDESLIITIAGPLPPVFKIFTLTEKPCTPLASQS